MSNVAHCALALAPSGSNFESLTKRLLALRAEIDAILAELASQAMEMPRAGAPMVAELVPQIEELSPVLSDPLTDSESMREATIEEAGIASEPSADENAPEQPIANSTALDPVEGEQETRDHEEQASGDPMSIAAIDTDPAAHAEVGLSPTTDMSAAIESMSAEQQGDAGILDAPQHSSALSTESDEARQEPAAQVDTAAAGVDAAPAGATVIGLHARQRKQKGALATGTPRSARSRSHLAAKIAACILVLLTAATILVMADRTAMGGVQSLPWMSPAPGAAAIDQSSQRGAAQTSDDAEPIIDLPPLSDGLLLRYREAWPPRS